MKLKKLVSIIIPIAMCLSIFTPFTSVMAAGNAYSCDFTQLVVDNADTAYGTADDIIALDDYTTAYLTYEGTYVSADGKVYIKSSTPCNGNGKYAQGSYIAFSAPSDGTLAVSGADIGWFEGNTYKGYGSSLTISATGGNMYYFGYRKGTTYINSLSFTAAEPTEEPIEEPTEEPIDEPTEEPVDDTVPVYQSPAASWDFNAYAPPANGVNVPYVTDKTEYSDGEITFPSGAAGSGYVTVDFDEPIRNNVEFSFDVTAHDRALGNQYINYRILNSEEEEIVSFSSHPYSSDASYGSNTVSVGGIAVKSGEDVRKLIQIAATTITTSVDYNARQVKITAKNGDAVIGDEIIGSIPESAAKDIAKFEFFVTRTKTAASRYISFDNLSVSEFTSTEPAAPAGSIADDYEEKNFGGVLSRVNAPSEGGLPLVVYLSGSSRFGTDNYSQLYNAQYLFDNLKGKAVLAAPQTENAWDISALKEYIDAAKAEYNASSVVAAGQFEGADAAYALAAMNAADKIITIAGTSDITSTNAKVWAFGGFLDAATKIADIRKPVNALQSAGADVRYTEYPTDGHNIVQKAAEQTGLLDWILGDIEKDKVVDLVLFSGQSNMAGRGTASEAIECPPGMGYEFHSITNPYHADGEVAYVLSTVAEPFGKNDNNSNINDNSGAGSDRRSGDMVSALMKAYYEASGVPMVGVQASRGGQATSYFTGSAVKGEMEARFKAAEEYLINAGYTIRKRAVVWCQGEADADAGRSESTYKGNTLTIWNNFKAMGITDMFIVKTGHYNINYGLSDGAEPTEASLTLDARYENVNKWQQEFADANDNVYAVANLYTDEYLAKMRDQYHYYQPVYNEVGETAGEAIAAIYKDEPVPTIAPTPAPTDTPGVSYSWDFETDQTAASGNNVPVISGTATYDETNKNIKLDSQSSTAGEVKVNLSPAAEGVITVDFDMNFGQLGSLSHVITASDNSGKEILNITTDVYNSTGTLKIGGETIASDREFTQYINSYRGDGMSAAVTHFSIEINYPKRAAAVTITKNSTTQETFNGNLSADTYTDKNVAAISVKSVHGKYTTGRASYLDNLKISSYTPAASIYATGAASVTKRLGMDVEEQYSLSKTYSDDSEIAEWSVEGVLGVTIDKTTGVLTVAENAKTGTAKVTVTLTKGGTLPTGTSDTIDVIIKDFSQPADYKIGGAATIETGKTTNIALLELTDTDGNDITEFAALGGFSSKDSLVASVLNDGTVTANKAGNTEITFNLTVDKLGYSKEITMPVKVGVYELTSSESEIDISSLISYGTDTYRIYSGTEYTDVSSSGKKVTNPYNGEVTVVPVYRFNYTNSALDGYQTATGEYSVDTGYGLISGQNYNINANGSLPASGRPLHIDLPYGNYDMNILRKGGARADVYNDTIQIINNSTSNGSQNRPSGSGLMYAPQVLIEDGSADITIGNTSGSNERIAALEIVRVPDKYKKHIVWVAGDSESANYYPINADGDDLQSDKIMMTGFGMQLPKFLSEDHYKVANWGQPSATVKTWYDECFKSVLYRMEKGDTIIVDFGINDSISSSNAISKDVMKQYMKDIFDAAKEKGVQAILVSPLWNSKYQSKSYFTYNLSSQTNEMYEFAKECHVPCIDLNKGTMLYKDRAIAETQDSSWVSHNYHVGDNLHQTQHSAVLCAAIIAGGMKQLGYITTDFSEVYSDISAFDAEDQTKRGTQSGVTREYGIAALADYITVDGEATVIIEPTPQPETSGITVDGDTVTVKVADTDMGVLIKAVYDTDKRLMNLKTYNLNFTDGTAVVEIPELGDGDELYVWDSLSGMKPLLDKVSVKKGAQEAAAPTPTQEVAEPTAEPTAEPSTILYSQDFESYAVGDKAGWTSPAGTLSVKNDSTEGIGNYQTVVSGKSGTCRSGYIEIPSITQNFVFEADYRSTSNVNVSDLELVENKNSVYANHGVYSNQNFVFTMARPKDSDVYVINNKSDDSGFTVDRYEDPVFTTSEITQNPWLHVKVVGNYDTQTVIVYITSLDGKTQYYRAVHDMNVGRDKNITSWKCIHLLSPTTGGDTCIDNIVVRTATKSDLAPVYHKVTITLGTVSFSQYVLDGENVVNIPSEDIYGDSFNGWKIGSDLKLYTSKELAAVQITEDCEIIGQIDESYIEALSVVEFKDFPAGNELVMGADENTYGDNTISLAITGEQGTSLVTNPDSRVTDYTIDWKFDGFRTLDGTPTGETGEKYCDSYGLVEITDKAQPGINFRLKKTSANYYGRVRASVTYNGKTIEIEKPLVLLGDKSNTTILPKAGYAADFNKYEDTMMGYRASSGDIVTGGWSTSGSDGTYMYLKSDSTGKYLSLSRAASGNSSYVHNEIGNITAQTVFEQDVRFGLDGTIRYIGGNTTSPTSTAFSFAKSGSNLTFNGKTVYSGANSSTWYHIVITADPTTKLTYAKVYDMSGKLLTQSDTVDFGTYTSGSNYEIVLSTKSNKSSIDINNVKIYESEIDANTFKVTAPETAVIPDTGTNEIILSADANTTDGDAAIGLVTWTIADELAEGVSIDSTGNNIAKLTISNTAASGNLPIRATLGGKSVTKEIKLTGTKNNVAFISAPSGIQLGTAGEYTYTAELRNGNAETLEGDITYSLVKSDGTAAEILGVSIDSSTGKLNVAKDAAPQTIYVKAVSGEVSRLTKTVLYSLKFSFGTDAPASGYTQVTSKSIYSDSKGFGVEGIADNSTDSISGSGITFKVKLRKGKVYSVTAKYEGTIRCERVDSNFTGFERTMDTLGEDTYSVAIFGDDIMDITLPSNGRLASVEITEVIKSAADKPDWWTIGDSTVQQNGSWGYTIASDFTTNLSKYPELAAVVNGFHNSGKAGEQHKNFYTNGRLNAILTQMNTGDIVSISGMGTNDSSSSKEQFKAYDEMYVNAILDMGGYVILGSYTPTGNYGATQGKVYDADTMTFKGMRTNAYDLAIRELYEEIKDRDQVLGFVDIGKMADEKMTADVRSAYESGGTDAATGKAEEMMAWWKDYNHYYTVFSNYILLDITKAVAELIEKIK